VPLRGGTVQRNNKRNFGGQSTTVAAEPVGGSGAGPGRAPGFDATRSVCVLSSPSPQFKRRRLRCRRVAPTHPKQVARAWFEQATRPQDLFAVIKHCAAQPCTTPVFVAGQRWPTGCKGEVVDLRAVAAEAAFYLPSGCNASLPCNTKAAVAASATLCTDSPLAEGLRAARADLYWLVAHAIYRTTLAVDSAQLRDALKAPWQFQPNTPSFTIFADVSRRVEATFAVPGPDIIVGGYPAAAVAYRDKCAIFALLFFGSPQWCEAVPPCAPPALRALLLQCPTAQQSNNSF